MIAPQGGVSTYAFDATGNPTLLVDPRGQVTSQVFDAADRCVSKRLPSGAVTRHAFTPNQWLQVIDTTGPTETAIVLHAQYDHRVGNRTGEAGLNRVRTLYPYDSS